jgi:hypothetical protein
MKMEMTETKMNETYLVSQNRTNLYKNIPKMVGKQ